MHFITKFIITLFTLFSIACTNAISGQEKKSGSTKEQICDAATIKLIGKFIKIDNFILPTRVNLNLPVNDDSNGDTVIVSSACKSMPSQKQITLAAIAYSSEKEDVKDLVIAMVDTAKGDVISSYHGEIEEDAALRIVSGSLWLDTAPYNLADGIRAFGLDVTSGYISHCAEGGMGASRTLYIQEENRIRPILQDLLMSHWEFTQPGMSTCMTGDTAPKNPIVKEVTLSIGLGNTTTNGFADLVVTAVSSNSNGKGTKQKPFRHLLHYDGQKYPLLSMEDHFQKWRTLTTISAH